MSISDEIGSLRSLLSVCSSQSQSDGEGSPSTKKRWTKGWQCDQWQVLDDLFCSIETLRDGTLVRKCSFCGMSFLEPPALDIREHHLRVTHNLIACTNKAKLYLDKDLFLLHMAEAHNASMGLWSVTLGQVCLVRRQPSGPVEGLESHAVDDVIPQGAESNVESAVEVWAEVEPQSNTEAFTTGFWDANLLGEWDSGRDRINRWMLHMLGAETKQTDVHHAIYQEKYGELLDVPHRMWSRLVLKYWFMDEAAIGFDMNALAEQLNTGKPENNHSSLHLSARPSGTQSGSGLNKVANELKLASIEPSYPYPEVESSASSEWELSQAEGVGFSGSPVGSVVNPSSYGRYGGSYRGSRVGSRASSMGSIAERLHSASNISKNLVPNGFVSELSLGLPRRALSPNDARPVFPDQHSADPYHADYSQGRLLWKGHHRSTGNLAVLNKRDSAYDVKNLKRSRSCSEIKEPGPFLLQKDDPNRFLNDYLCTGLDDYHVRGW